MSRIISYLTNGTPWAIEQSALETIIAIAQRDNNLEAVLQERGRPMENTHKVEVRNGVAIVPVTGALFPRANLFSQVSGAYSVEMLATDLAQTVNDPNVKATVLMIDSPGGNTVMINEFANQVADYPKPIVAYVVGQAASAAYWIAAAADKIILDSTAMVGSIGIVAAFSAPDSKTIEIVSSNAQDKRPDITTDAGNRYPCHC
ncbi:MAG: S49 family peptidase [Saprospiraceae bacterium]|nr:S49 family peptidase [Saprospiraceae bacterium]